MCGEPTTESSAPRVRRQHPHGCPLGSDEAGEKRVERAATAAGVNIAPWLCSVVRQTTVTNFPASWHEPTAEERSHESRSGTRFMLRLDKTSQSQLQQLISHFAASKAKIVRQLIMQATPEDVPKSWHMSAAERAMPPIRRKTRHKLGDHAMIRRC
jgi:hypothetical protein